MMTTIGHNIKVLRERHGYSLSKLARKCGISKSYLHGIESGTYDNIGLQIAIDIAKVFNVPLDTLVDKKTITGYMRGHLCYFNQHNQQWYYMDNDLPFDDTRPCPKCNKLPTPEGHDACLGHIPGVSSACCGHGREDGAIIWEVE
jgi:transcriptional regulator with XRE-family HTH domain